MDRDELLKMAMAFHGHKCPAMPLGLRAGLAAMEKLGAQRAGNSELYLISESGKQHAMSCFVDGLQAATGCTYGKYNIEKTYHDKLAFTLIDRTRNRAVRVAVKPEFQAKALQSEFVKQREAGVPATKVPDEVTDPLVQRVWTLPVEQMFDIGEPFEYHMTQPPTVFRTEACSNCGALVFEKGIRMHKGKLVCQDCWPYGESGRLKTTG
jgi:formylmethanofuran dehydrogenase subunit E